MKAVNFIVTGAKTSIWYNESACRGFARQSHTSTWSKSTNGKTERSGVFAENHTDEFRFAASISDNARRETHDRHIVVSALNAAGGKKRNRERRVDRDS